MRLNRPDLRLDVAAAAAAAAAAPVGGNYGRARNQTPPQATRNACGIAAQKPATPFVGQ